MTNFSYARYKNFLEKAKSTHKFVFFYEFSEEDIHQIILRHDIDLSLESALNMAEIEKDIGVKSTYFIRLNSTFYNPISQLDYPRVARIIEMGHDIGLHFDPSFYDSNGINVLSGIHREKRMLELAFDIQVRSISQHRPFNLGQLEGNDSELLKYFAYNDKFFKKCKYISDSGQRWREGEPEKHLHNVKLQVLVHPIWWNEDHISWEECLHAAKFTCIKPVEDKTQMLVERYEKYLAAREDAKCSN